MKAETQQRTTPKKSSMRVSSRSPAHPRNFVLRPELIAHTHITESLSLRNDDCVSPDKETRKYRQSLNAFSFARHLIGDEESSAHILTS
jgi:hypothetical protein